MPSEQTHKKSLNAFLRLSQTDIALFHYVMGKKSENPTLTDKACIEAFYKEYDISTEDYNLDYILVSFSNAKKRYREFCKTETEFKIYMEEKRAFKALNKQFNKKLDK
jgi:hypothetical protein